MGCVEKGVTKIDSSSHVKFSYFVQQSEKHFVKRILQSVRCHLNVHVL